MDKKGNWTREQLLIALKLYCELPFGQFHSKNPQVIYFSELIGRTPSALAMKLSNFASLDPIITSSGRKGLSGASQADKAIWEELNFDWESLSIEVEKNSAELTRQKEEKGKNVEPAIAEENTNYFGRDKQTLTKTRLGQNFFRKSVLSSYQSQCCISGLAVPSLLVASHIIPWSKDEKNRLNPRNGLCLSALHDKAFDTGIITISDEMTVHVSQKISNRNDKFFESVFLAFEGKRISLPEKFSPNQEFLSYHRQHIFERNL